MMDEQALLGHSFVVGREVYVRAPRTYLSMAAPRTLVAVRPFSDGVSWHPVLAQFVGLCPNGKKSEVFFEGGDFTVDVPTQWVYVTTATRDAHQQWLGAESAE